MWSDIRGVMNPNPKPYYTRKDLCATLQVSMSSLKRCESSGDLKPTRVSPRIVRYRDVDVEAFLARRKRQNPPDSDKQ